MSKYLKILSSILILLLLITCKYTLVGSWTKAVSGPDLDQDVLVYPPIRGIEKSRKYTSSVFDGKVWKDLFTMEAIGPEKVRDGKTYKGVYEDNTGVSSSWSTFETRVPVKVKVTRIGGEAITKCIIRPLSRNLKPEIIDNGKAVIVEVPLRKVKKKQVPVNIVFEINGNQRETMSMFISPHLEKKPSPLTSGVYKVHPGTDPPESGDWHTLYFMPGVHYLGTKAYPVTPGKNYYIPGDAWIDGGFMGKQAHGARIFGLGVISGRKFLWENVSKKKTDKLMFLGGKNAILEGITFIDSHHHTLFGGSPDPAQPSIMRNVKTHNFRHNTDGIHFFGSGIAEDCFIHGADDAHYLTSRSDVVRFSRMVYWTDMGFGVHIIFSAQGEQISASNSIAEDCDSIYYNRIWGGNIIDQRNLKKGGWVDGAVIQDLRVEDPPANGSVISLRLPSHPCTFKNVLLKNITIHSNNGYPFEVTGGGPDSIIENITFEDIKIEGEYLDKITPETFSIAFAKNIRLVKNGKTAGIYSSDIEKDSKHIRPDPDNLLTNPGFEIPGFAWQGMRTGKEKLKPRSGDYCYKATKASKDFGTFKQGVASGLQEHGAGKYQLTAWLYIPEGSAKGVFNMSWGVNNPQTAAYQRDEKVFKGTTLVPGKWTKVSAVFDFPYDREKYPSVHWANFSIKAQGKYKEVYIDDVSMIKVKK